MDHLPAQTEEELKRARVLDGALKVFLSYGYKRATMDDIAKAAEMSRPALYLFFRNKGDIYRAIGQRMFDMSATAIADVMKGEGTIGERLFTSVDQVMIEMMCQISESPHGAELLDLKNELAVGMLEEWHDKIAGVFRDAIQADSDRSGINLATRGLSADGLAELLLDGLEGMKHRVTDPAAQRAAGRQLVRVIELALKA